MERVSTKANAARLVQRAFSLIQPRRKPYLDPKRGLR